MVVAVFTIHLVVVAVHAAVTIGSGLRACRRCCCMIMALALVMVIVILTTTVAVSVAHKGVATVQGVG